MHDTAPQYPLVLYPVKLSHPASVYQLLAYMVDGELYVRRLEFSDSDRWSKPGLYPDPGQYKSLEDALRCLPRGQGYHVVDATGTLLARVRFGAVSGVKDMVASLRIFYSPHPEGSPAFKLEGGQLGDCAVAVESDQGSWWDRRP